MFTFQSKKLATFVLSGTLYGVATYSAYNKNMRRKTKNWNFQDLRSIFWKLIKFVLKMGPREGGQLVLLRWSAWAEQTRTKIWQCPHLFSSLHSAKALSTVNYVKTVLKESVYETSTLSSPSEKIAIGSIDDERLIRGWSASVSWSSQRAYYIHLRLIVRAEQADHPRVNPPSRHFTYSPVCFATLINVKVKRRTSIFVPWKQQNIGGSQKSV